MISRLLFIVIFLISCNQDKQEFGVYNIPDAFNGIGIENSLGIELPLGVKIHTLENNESTLKDYFSNEIPKLLILGYYTCPMLCNSARDNLFSQIQNTDLILGVDYEILMISIDHSDNLINAEIKL